MIDEYQRRYLEHRKRKAAMIAAEPEVLEVDLRRVAWQVHTMMAERVSTRVFQGKAVPPTKLRQILEDARLAPQSCNRQALKLTILWGMDVGEWLMGGEGWLAGAPVAILVFADLAAYKSPHEVIFMPWLDAGVMLATLVYAATACGLGSCIVNPRVRSDKELGFRERFNRDGRLFCGAVAIGYSGKQPERPEKREISEFVEWLYAG